MYTNANMNTHVCVYKNIYMNTTIQDYKRIDDIDVCLSICIYTYIYIYMCATPPQKYPPNATTR